MAGTGPVGAKPVMAPRRKGIVGGTTKSTVATLADGDGVTAAPGAAVTSCSLIRYRPGMQSLDQGVNGSGKTAGAWSTVSVKGGLPVTAGDSSLSSAAATSVLVPDSAQGEGQQLMPRRLGAEGAGGGGHGQNRDGLFGSSCGSSSSSDDESASSEPDSSSGESPNSSTRRGLRSDSCDPWSEATSWEDRFDGDLLLSPDCSLGKGLRLVDERLFCPFWLGVKGVVFRR